MSADAPDREARVRRLARAAAERLGLDLRGLTVLTEAATGWYRLTPLLAAAAGAERVLALTRDSRHGTAEAVRAGTMAAAERWRVADRIEVLARRDDPRIREADVVTNLGFVRPFDAAFLETLKPTAAIPLMWETWEHRPDELDLEACRRLDLCVLGTDESHPALRTFEYIGHVALKLLHELDVEGARSRVIVLGHGPFADQVADLLVACGSDVSRVEPDEAGRWPEDALWAALGDADALVVVEAHDRGPLVTRDGPYPPERIAALSSSVAVAHIGGSADRDALTRLGLACAPQRFAAPGYMSVATDYVGPRPLIDLHTAGLAVGTALTRARRRGLSRSEAEAEVLERVSFSQAFPESPDR